MLTNPTRPNLRRNSRPVPVFALHILLAVVTLASTLAPSEPAQAATKRTDKREIDARQAFASGKYQQALELYAELYADKVHPTYLRNVARCYQNLQQPDKAINAFRDYLRQAKALTPEERSEVEGYIAEMEQMRQQQEGAAKAAQQPTILPPATPPTTPLNPTPGPAGTTLQTTSQVPVAPPQPTPFYKKGWFWGVAGAVVVAGVVGGLYLGGAFSKSSISCTRVDGCF